MRPLIAQALVVALLLVFFPSSFPRAQEDETLPAYARRGPYAVGTQDLRLEDDQRPLAITIWYPALNPDGAPERASYDVGLRLSRQGRALRDAPPDPGGGPYPLVIFSHGLGGLRVQSLFLTEHLASYGFVVIAADHPGSTLYDSIFSGNSQGIITSFAWRPLEVLREIALAETLTAAGGPLAGLIDTDRVAVSGHSFGGYTAIAAGGGRLDFDALEAWCRSPWGMNFEPGDEPPFQQAPIPRAQTGTACLMRAQEETVARIRGLETPPEGPWPATTDPRIRAVVALAPANAPLFGAEGLATLTVPTMIQVGSADSLTPPERDAYRFYADLSHAAKTLVVFQGANHLIFADGLPLVGDAVWDLDEAHALINHLTTAFLRSVLYSDADAAAALLPEAVDFAGITYLTTP